MVAPTTKPDSPSPPAEAAVACPNCGGTTIDQFCAGCGQRRPEPTDYALRPLLLAAVEQVTSYDARLLRTLRALTIPGQLTRDHFEGRRARYVGPFQTFVLFNLAAWFVIPHSKIAGFSLAAVKKIALAKQFWTSALDWRAGTLGLSAQQFAARVESVIPTESKFAVLAMVPLFALMAWLLLRGRGFKPVQHLVFAGHFYCVFLVVFIASWALAVGPLLRHFLHGTGPLAAGLAGFLARPWVQHLSVAPMILPYLYFALQRTYALTPKQAGWRAAALAMWASTLTRAFLDIACALVLVFA